MSEETKVPFTFVDAPRVRDAQGRDPQSTEAREPIARRRQRPTTPDSFVTFSLIVSALVEHPPAERKRIVDTLTNLYR